MAAILTFAACSDSKSVEELTMLPDTETEMNHLAECEAWKAIPGGVTQYVDPKIGSGGHGHVFVGANVPFSMVQLGPTSIPTDWDWCSGYHDSDNTVIGFSHTHLSGTGAGDLGDITVMPVIGDVTYARGKASDQKSGLWSYADRSKEITHPGYYSVPLLRYNVLAELTATQRVGFHRYTFPDSQEAAIVIDLENGIGSDQVREVSMTVEGTDMVVGYRRSTGWASDQYVYFAAQFSKPFISFDLHGNSGRYGRASFSTAKGEQILLKIALSPVSVEGAKKNLSVELAEWDFDKTVAAANLAWNEELGKVRIHTVSKSYLRIFYTALYHTMVAPSIYSDVNSSNTAYTTFSLWDTYRAAMPLMTILHPDRMPDIINSMLDIYDKQGRLPVWHLWGNETDCMVGNPAIPVVADAIVKGFKDIDMERAFTAIKMTANHDGRGGSLRKQYGYIPCDLFQEAIAYDMEYAIADAAVAAAANHLGKDDDYRLFTERSHSYRNYFDESTGFVRGKDSNGNWRTPFDPFASQHRADDYCEGNAWQYTWLVPHDINGLSECFGGHDKCIEKLDSLFVLSEIVGAGGSPDISGLIGQYAHGNEPGHHILYLYSMLDQPWKTAARVREILTSLYHAAPDGLCGNEDVGQMSAWYVLSALGFYQVEPASARYWFGTPLFDRTEITVPGGKLVLIAKNNSILNKYIRKITLNGCEYTKPYISYTDIMAGGELVFEMGATPQQ
jgi:putative alpha-1,2-mannosidase